MISSRDKLSGPIPADCMSLSDVRDAVIRAAMPGEYVLSEKALELHRALRNALAAGELQGLILGKNGERLTLCSSDWALRPKDDDNPGFLDDYVFPGAAYHHGPDTTLGTGKHRRVFIQRTEFDAWLKSKWPNAEPQSSARGASAPVLETTHSPLTNRDDIRKDVEKSFAQFRRFESERVIAKPDWSVWNVLSWIAFRDLALLCEIANEDELMQLCEHPSLKEAAPEAILLCALARDELQAFRDGEELPDSYWIGKAEVDRDIWFKKDSVQNRWNNHPWSLAQMMLWIITRDSQQVEDSRASGLDGPWAALVIEQRPITQVESAASKLTEICRQRAIQTFDGHSPIKSDVWDKLEIKFIEGVPFVQWRARLSDAVPNIGFSRVDALREFRPNFPGSAHFIQLTAFGNRRALLIASIERRLEAPVLRDRTHCRVTEIVEDRVPDGSVQRRAEYFRTFELALKAGLFNGGKRDLSQLFFAHTDCRFSVRLTHRFLIDYLVGYEGARRARMLENLLRRVWIPRPYISRWLTDYGLGPLPSWLKGAIPSGTEQSPPTLSTAPEPLGRNPTEPQDDDGIIRSGGARRPHSNWKLPKTERLEEVLTALPSHIAKLSAGEIADWMLEYKKTDDYKNNKGGRVALKKAIQRHRNPKS
jgi:hypothetical protein